MKNAICLILLTIVSFTTFAQKTTNDPVLEEGLFKPYDSYFNIEREWVYTHLNKSAYIQGDDIWFTSYVLNPENRRLNFATSKLYVELWSSQKKLVSQKILFVKAGTSDNYIHLPDSLAPGTYSFRAYTSWMRNFYTADDLNRLITVLGHLSVTGLKAEKGKAVDQLNFQKKNGVIQETRPDYDIQFLPEGGVFLEGVENILGIKATDPLGNGLKLNGKIFDSKNQELQTFETNELGMGCVMIPETGNQQYTAKVTLPDSTVHDILLPKPAPLGINIHVNPYLHEAVWFRIQTNEATRQLNKSYVVMLHANGALFTSYRIKFSKENGLQFKLNKKDIGNGIVYATVFDENLTPVAERLFFSQDSSAKGNLTVNAQSLGGDTVNVKIQVTDSLASPRFAKLSVSVLPGETILNHFDNSLGSESIFRPALRGRIENADSYFEKNDVEHIMAIDNLLLTQGWRKYDWPTILKDTIHQFTYPFEEAFTIEGGVKNWIRNKPELKSRITFISPQNNIFLMSPVDSLGKFKYDRVYLNDSTWVIASATSSKGSNWNRVLQMTIPEFVMEAPDIQQQTTEISKKNQEEFGEIPQLTKGVIQLKEVVITAQKKNPFEGNMYVGMMDRTFELTKENYTQFSNMQMLLMIKFNVRSEPTADGGYRFDMGRGMSSSSQSPKEPNLMIDGMKVSEARDILDFPLEMVEAVAVNKDGLGGGMDGSGGTIAIKTRTKPLFENTADASNIKKLLVRGYAAPKKYFEPKYIIQPGTPDYGKYATIFWKPDLVTGSDNSAAFRFYVPHEIRNITLRIEGISFEGKTFLHNQKIDLPGR